DVLSAKKALSAKVSALESIVAEEFHSLFAVATLQAIQAQTAAGVDEAMFHASGGSALSSEVLRHAERGRRADFDSAHMFLARYQIKDVPAGTRPKPQPVPEVAPGIPEPVTEPVETPVPPAKPASIVPAAVSVENVSLFVESIHFLKRRGEGLSQTVADLG
ncbi:unnamed protein product, partial [Ectocarpus sp. 12 AP-2014]